MYILNMHTAVGTGVWGLHLFGALTFTKIVIFYVKNQTILVQPPKLQKLS